MKRILVVLSLMFSFGFAVDVTFYATNPQACTFSYPLCSYAKQTGILFRNIFKAIEMKENKQITKAQMNLLVEKAQKDYYLNICLDFKVMNQNERIMLGDMEFYYIDGEGPVKRTEDELIVKCAKYW